MNGFFDNAALHGEITGSGPNFQQAKDSFLSRQKSMAEVGTWRMGPCKWKVNQGRHIDPDYYIVNYGQDDE